MKTKIIYIIIGLIILSQLAFAGVTNPLPSELNLLKGESGRFKFQVQAIESQEDMECIPSIEEDTALDVEFDEDTIIVSAGSIKEVYGTVTAPKNIGTYVQNFCVSCQPSSSAAGTSVKKDTCGLPITVNVVLERERENMTVEPEKPISVFMIVLIAVAFIAAAYIILYIIKKKKGSADKKTIDTKQKKTPKKAKKKK
ncbi:hypothetical protein GF336_02125 [Candidatus Woesearchaeota archaeon]|nr:hypothetical protein [Candidatus Woesearchaeota archaeon]